MKTSFASVLTLAAALAVGSLTLTQAATVPGQIDFNRFTGFPGGQLVEINLNSSLIGLVTKLAGKADPEAAKVLGGLKSIRVNVVGMNQTNRDAVQTQMDSVKQQLDEQGWQRVVTAQEKNQDVGIFMKMRGDEAVEGIVITVMNGSKEAVFINIVGDIRPEQLASVAERLNLDPLKQASSALGVKK